MRQVLKTGVCVSLSYLCLRAIDLMFRGLTFKHSPRCVDVLHWFWWKCLLVSLLPLPCHWNILYLYIHTQHTLGLSFSWLYFHSFGWNRQCHCLLVHKTFHFAVSCRELAAHKVFPTEIIMLLKTRQMCWTQLPSLKHIQSRISDYFKLHCFIHSSSLAAVFSLVFVCALTHKLVFYFTNIQSIAQYTFKVF